MSTFQQLLDRVRPTGRSGQFSAEVEASWLQGRTAFGGLSSALVYEAMRRGVDEDRRLRALSVSFVGPVTTGGHTIQLRNLREGGSVTHLHGELITEGEVNLSALAAFGRKRRASIRQSGPPMPDVPSPEASQPLPFIQGVTPDFTRHFEMRFAFGAPPFAGADDADFGMWLRFREPTTIDTAALVALADVPPMPGLNRIQAPGVGSSLTWYLDFPSVLPIIADQDWLYYDYRCQSAGDSYYNNSSTIWGPHGEALLYSRQVAMVFEK